MDWYGNNVCTFGQKLYFDFAREWDYPYFWDKRLRKDFTVGPRYTYSHVNSLSSAAMAYLATKDESYRNFGDSVCVRDDKWGSCEVSCCSWAVFKLCNYLLMLTGEARFGDWGGSSCTTAAAEYANMLYYQDREGLYVSQYLPSQVRYKIEDTEFALENVSLYPKEKLLHFVLHGEKEKRFASHFRVPTWASGANRIWVNGEAVAITVCPNEWASLNRCWKEGYSFSFRTKPGHVKPFAHLTRDFYPYYEVGEREWYYMYNRIEKKE